MCTCVQTIHVQITYCDNLYLDKQRKFKSNQMLYERVYARIRIYTVKISAKNMEKSCEYRALCQKRF